MLEVMFKGYHKLHVLERQIYYPEKVFKSSHLKYHATILANWTIYHELETKLTRQMSYFYGH